MKDNELRQVLVDCLTANTLKRNGQVLYSGIDTLIPGDFYFVGFNPAADGTNPVLQEVQLDRREWSAYTQQCWYHPHRNETCPKAGRAPHQVRVRSIMLDLGLIPEKTFATNLIFVESRNIAEIKTEIHNDGLFDCCWRVHKKMLAVVRPRFILCLGNGECDSAFSLVRKKATNACKVNAPGSLKVSSQRHVALKGFNASFDLDDAPSLPIRVIGVPHPSRWKCPPVNAVLSRQQSRQPRGE